MKRNTAQRIFSNCSFFNITRVSELRELPTHLSRVVKQNGSAHSAQKCLPSTLQLQLRSSKRRPRPGSPGTPGTLTDSLTVPRYYRYGYHYRMFLPLLIHTSCYGFLNKGSSILAASSMQHGCSARALTADLFSTAEKVPFGISQEVRA